MAMERNDATPAEEREEPQQHPTESHHQPFIPPTPPTSLTGDSTSTAVAEMIHEFPQQTITSEHNEIIPPPAAAEEIVIPAPQFVPPVIEPTQAIPEQLARRTSRIKYERMRILIADDAAVTVRIMSKLFERKGFSVDTADNGTAVCSKVINHSTSMKSCSSESKTVIDKYNVLLIDLGMPVMDGFDAIKAIRAVEKDSNNSESFVDESECATKLGVSSSTENCSNEMDGAAAISQRQIIIAMSTGMNEETKAAVLAAGADGVLMKPFTFLQFEKVFKPLHNRTIERPGLHS